MIRRSLSIKRLQCSLRDPACRVCGVGKVNTGWKPMLVRLRVRTNSGVEVPIGQITGCP